MADIGTVTVNLSPTIDTDALAASIRTAVADALEQVAGELRAGVTAQRWTIGQALTTADLDELPLGAVVRDRDGDSSTRIGSVGDDIDDGTPRVWERRYSSGGLQATVASSSVAIFSPVTLVSLP